MTGRVETEFPKNWPSSEVSRQHLRNRLCEEVLEEAVMRISRITDEMVSDPSDIAAQRLASAYLLYELRDAVDAYLNAEIADAELTGAPLRRLAWATGHDDTASLKRKFPRLQEVIKSRTAAKQTGRTFMVAAGRKRKGLPDGAWDLVIGPHGAGLAARKQEE